MKLEESEKDAILDDYRHYLGAHKRYMLNEGWRHAMHDIESQSADPDYMVGYGRWQKLKNKRASNNA